MVEQTKKYQQMIAKCWLDDEFKQKLLADPDKTLKAEGIEVPEGMEVFLLENTPQRMYVVIPSKPRDLSEGVIQGPRSLIAATNPQTAICQCGAPPECYVCSCFE